MISFLTAMIENSRILERDSQFFAINFRTFKEDLAQIPIIDKEPSFVQLSLKCCGYGYFQNYQHRMVDNFLYYLKEALKNSPELTTLKIVFNGFDVGQGRIIQRICEPILQIARRVNFKTLWIHTNNLRSCRVQDVSQFFKIIDNFGIQEYKSDEISLQMSDWEFTKGYPSYQGLFNVFLKFNDSIPQGKFLFFRKFRLQISKWYLSDKEAYSFLKDTVNQKAIINSFFSSENDQSSGISHNRVSTVSKLKDMDSKSAQELIQDYLTYLDLVHLFPDLPNKKKYRNQHQKAKKEREEIIRKMKQCQDKISTKIMKFPMEYITQLRVDSFQNQMAKVIIGLIYRIQELLDFQIDMRNWNPMFNLGTLKKRLDTQTYTKKQFSILRKQMQIKSIRPMKKKKEERGMNQEERNGFVPKEQPTLKAKFTM